MKKFLLLCLSVLSLQMYGQKGTCGNDAKWKFNKVDSTLTIEGQGDVFDYKDPYYNHDGQPSWEPYKKKIKKVIVKEGITRLGEYTFSGCPNLTKVVFEGHTFVGFNGYTFSYCTQLSDIEFPSSLENIGRSTFEGCNGLRFLTIPENVKTIGYAAFSKCTGLDSIQYNAIEAKMDRMYPKSTFMDCKNLSKVKFGANVRSLDQEIFYELPKLTTLEGQDSIHYVGYRAFYQTPWEEALPTDTILYVGKAAYLYKTKQDDNDVEIYLEEGTKSVTPYAFANNKMLTKVSVPRSLDRLGEGCFSKCNALGSVIWNADSVGNFEASPFTNSLYEITLGEHVKHIPAYFMKECEGVDLLEIPASVRVIGTNAFNSCTGLTKLVIPETVDSVAAYAFDFCSAVDTLVMNARVCYSNLRGLSSLKTITFGRKLQKLNFYDLLEHSNLLEEVVWNPAGEVEMTYALTYHNLKKPFRRLIFGNHIQNIPGYFNGNDSLQEIVWPDSLVSISDNAFAECQKIQKISFPNMLQTIGSSTFSRCSSLKEVELPDALKSIGSFAFEECGSLTKINFPDSIESIGKKCFYYAALTECFIPSSVKVLGSNAFYHNKIKKAIIASDQVAGESIIDAFGTYSFSDSTKIYLPDVSVINKYNSFYKYAHPIVVSDSATTYVYNGEAPVVNFRGNVPGYKMTSMVEPEMAVNAGNHKAIVKATFEGERTFTVNAAWNYIIEKADQTIEWNQNYDKLGIGDSIQLVATSNSGIEPTFYFGGYVSQLHPAELKKHEDGSTWLHCKNYGEIRLIAAFESNENWNKASVERTIYINKVSAVEDVLGDAVQVKAGLRSITLSGMTAGMSIGVYAVDGKTISNAVATAATQTFAVAQGGVYIVKVNGKQFKVVVK